MRFLAILPILMCVAALVLSFLALFAGSKKSFMQDYAIVTLNTSRIGENVINSTSTSSSSDPLESLIYHITSSIESDIESDLNSYAKDLGIHDFYSAHILDFCEGYYTPTSVPNATFPLKDIHENVTSCSNTTAFYNFDPREIIQRELNASGHSDISLSDLDWPTSIDKGLKALHVAQKATFILYCIGIAFIAIATVFALLSIIFEGRLASFINVLLCLFAFAAIGIASALVTVIGVKAAHLINKYGNKVGISADKGGKFLAVTWVATALMLLCSIVWCFDCIVGRKRHTRRTANRNEYEAEK